MALRTIIHDGDPLLRKKSRPVEKFDERLHTLLDDMKETMDDANGVGLAAPQISVLRRIVIIDIGEGLIEMINPKIVYESSRCEEDSEGCLSSPGEYGLVSRPMKVTVTYQNRFGEECETSGEGLLARAFCHECDHLDGILFKDRARRMLDREDD